MIERAIPGSQRSQSPQFDDSCQDDENFGENESVFGRLEQSREALEKRIGHEILIQAYNIIQVGQQSSKVTSYISSYFLEKYAFLRPKTQKLHYLAFSTI